MRSYWSKLYEDEICAVSAPTESTGINGYGYHVAAGGKETCDGDEGSPLLCDIDGEVTLVGINSRGYDRCGVEGCGCKKCRFIFSRPTHIHTTVVTSIFRFIICNHVLGYPAIHLNLNSIHGWMQIIMQNHSGVIWSEWSDCNSDCKQFRKRSKYESEVRDCERVCFKTVSDTIDESLRTCPITGDRKKRDANREKRILGGQSVTSSAMKYVAKLVFDNAEQCVGTVIDKYFILTTKYCCQSGDTVLVTFDSNSIELKSSTFYVHSTFDSCLIRIEADLRPGFTYDGYNKGFLIFDSNSA